MAKIIPIRALLRAICMASPWEEARKEMVESDSKPIDRTVSNIIKVKETTKANPRCLKAKGLLGICCLRETPKKAIGLDRPACFSFGED